jgi:hypothetical protein
MAEEVSLAISQTDPPQVSYYLSMAYYATLCFGQHGTRPENPIKADYQLTLQSLLTFVVGIDVN